MQSVCSIMLSLNISLLSFLPDRNFTGAHCAIVPCCPPPLGSAPLTGPHCSPQLFISTFLISHARISEQSAILINVSCFSALPVQGITHTHEDLGRYGMSGRVGGGLIGIQINGHILGRQSVYLPKDYCCHQVKNLSSSREGLIYSLKRFFSKKKLYRICTHCCPRCSFLFLAYCKRA